LQPAVGLPRQSGSAKLHLRWTYGNRFGRRGSGNTPNIAASASRN